MARNQLLVTPAGRAVLAVPERVDTARGREIKAAFNAWRDADPPELLIAGETEIRLVDDIELALAPAEDPG